MVKEGEFGLKLYIKTSTSEDASNYFRLRLEMFDIGNNQGKQRQCVCGEPEELEHLVRCERIKERIAETTEIDNVKRENAAKLEETVRWINRDTWTGEQTIITNR